MRPVEKKQPGEVVQYTDSRGNVIDHVVLTNYRKYGDAKLPLIGNLGRYCSYCERLRDEDASDVEHRDARDNGGSETAWDNFLLSCKICNSVKTTTDYGEDIHWPHLNNTYLDFVYDETGRVKVNPALSGLSKTRAENLYRLVHLGRDKDDPTLTTMDYRWQKRYETWNKAVDAKAKYEAGKWNEDDIIGKAKDTGYWSVWFTVFTGIDSILSRLISDFVGTCTSCFDAANHYKPIPRNPENAVDPI